MVPSSRNMHLLFTFSLLLGVVHSTVALKSATLSSCIVQDGTKKEQVLSDISYCHDGVVSTNINLLFTISHLLGVVYSTVAP